MKNIIKLIGIALATIIIGFSFTACDGGDNDKDNDTDGKGSSAINGRWLMTSGGERWGPDDEEIILIFTNGNFTSLYNGDEWTKGKYSISGSNITMAITHYKLKLISKNLPDRWYNEQQTKTAINGSDFYFESQSGTYTLTGNTLEITLIDNDDGDEETATFTRQ